MVDRYYRWFFDNYTNYKYIGAKAKAVMESIKQFILKNDPNIFNFNTIYASFMALYRGNIVSDIKAEGIFPLKGNYYLIFTEDEVLVPLAYIEFYKRVTEIELENIVLSEIRRQEVYYDSLIGQKEVLVNKCDRLIRNSGNHTGEVKNAKLNCIFYFLLLLIPIIPLVGLLFDEAIAYIGLSQLERWIIFGFSCVLTLVYLILLYGFFEDIKILQRGRKINQELYDIELRLHTNHKNVGKINVRKIIVAIKSGSKIKGRINDTDYKQLYYKAEDKMEDIEKDKVLKTKLKYVVYHVSNGFIMVYSTIIAGFLFVNYNSKNFTFNVYEYMPVISAILITGVLFVPCYFIMKKIRVRNIFIRLILVNVLQILLWYFLSTI